jgi:hypothetical protein
MLSNSGACLVKDSAVGCEQDARDASTVQKTVLDHECGVDDAFSD